MMKKLSLNISRVKLLIIAALLCPFFGMSQDSIPKSRKAGFAIHLGAGNLYGGNLGILSEWQILLKEKIRISPFISLGAAEAGEDSASQKTYYWFGYTAGLNLEYGKKHRIIFGPHFVGNQLMGSSEAVKKSSLTGLSVILGYKGCTDFGLIWQVYIGNLYSMDDDPFSSNMSYSNRSHFGLGLGYKW
jgi:hypothetical protein